jgi:SpoVK/Ycf46/Vps4 family AAA+-type ATPase
MAGTETTARQAKCGLRGLVKECGSLHYLKLKTRIVMNAIRYHSNGIGRGEELAQFIESITTGKRSKSIGEARANDLVRAIFGPDENEKDVDLSRPSEKVLSTYVRICAQSLKQLERFPNQPDPFRERLEQYRDCLNLDELETVLLGAVFIIGNDPDGLHIFGHYLDHSSGDSTRIKIRFFAETIEAKYAEVLKRLSSSGKLQRYGLLEKDLAISSQAVRFIDQIDDVPLRSLFVKKYEGDCIDIGHFRNIAEERDMVLQLIRNNKPQDHLHILLYGSPGTGKTEFARALAQAAGRALHEIPCERDAASDRSGNQFRMTALNACRNLVDHTKSIILVDEADEIINGNGASALFINVPSRNQEKGRLNLFLDDAPGIYFWISNLCDHIDDSTRRRFDYAIEFLKMGVDERMLVWQTTLRKYGAYEGVPKSVLAEINAACELTPGGIDTVAKNLSRLGANNSGAWDESEFRRAADMLIASHEKIMGGKDSRKRKAEPVKEYCLEGLNIKSAPSLEVVRASAVRFSESLRKNSNGKRKSIAGMNILLYGPPGSGKTEFAKHLASTCGLPLEIQGANDLLDMYVGGTEQRIHAAFKEAAGQNAILLIDEADGLISDRRSAVRSWEVSQVNQFLVEIENYPGIVICATNFRETLDSAMFRRFAFKIRFDYLVPDGVRLFFDRILQPISGQSLEPDEERELLSIPNLTPGDFKAVCQQYRFLPPAESTNRDLIRSLQDELALKKDAGLSKIGFASP